MKHPEDYIIVILACIFITRLVFISCQSTNEPKFKRYEIIRIKPSGQQGVVMSKLDVGYAVSRVVNRKYGFASKPNNTVAMFFEEELEKIK